MNKFIVFFYPSKTTEVKLSCRLYVSFKLRDLLIETQRLEKSLIQTSQF